MDIYIDSGESIDVIAPYDVTAADPLRLGSMFGFCGGSAEAGDKVALKVLGTYNVVKTAGETWSVGEVLYFDDSTKAFTTSNVSGSTKVGVAIEAAVSAAVVGKLRLSGAF